MTAPVEVDVAAMAENHERLLAEIRQRLTGLEEAVAALVEATEAERADALLARLHDLETDMRQHITGGWGDELGPEASDQDFRIQAAIDALAALRDQDEGAR